MSNRFTWELEEGTIPYAVDEGVRCSIQIGEHGFLVVSFPNDQHVLLSKERFVKHWAQDSRGVWNWRHGKTPVSVRKSPPNRIVAR